MMTDICNDTDTCGLACDDAVNMTQALYNIVIMTDMMTLTST